MSELIASRDNPAVKLCRRLLSGASARREEGLFLAEGARLCGEALGAGIRVETALATEEALEKYGSFLRDLGPRLRLITPSVAKAVSDTKSPQGVFCICALPKEREFRPQKDGRYLLLDRLQDPGNLGTIIRGAEAFGITGVVLSDGCPDLYSPKVLRSTMGSAFRQPVFYARPLTEGIRRMKEEGIRLYAAALDPGAVRIGQLSGERGGMGVVVGNEGNGVSDEVQRECGASVYIPMTPAIESLNAAAAATVIMWELAGRRD